MAYNTVPSTSGADNQMTSSAPDVITIMHEKEFALKILFNNVSAQFNKANVYYKIYEDNGDQIPLTSVIYVPNKIFFEKSKFFKKIGNVKTEAFLKKHNIFVIVYGITSHLDHNLKTYHTYSDTMLVKDIIQTSGCLAPYTTTDTSNIDEDMDNLMRFENSPFNYRLNAIHDRIKNVYRCNYTPINYLIFNDLNNDTFISNFMKNTINITLV